MCTMEQWNNGLLLWPLSISIMVTEYQYYGHWVSVLWLLSISIMVMFILV